MGLQLSTRVGMLSIGLAGAIALAACGAPGAPASSRHVVPTTSMPATLPVSADPSLAPTQATSGENPVDSAAATQAFNQIQGDLGSLDTNLSQVSSDLSSPQGDS
jgi:hypothetical protein